MSLNIKSERAVALVRALAARTGSTQTSAVEDAVARRLAELDREDVERAGDRRASVEDVLRQLNAVLTDGDRQAIRQSDAELHDPDGLPR